MVRPGFRAVAFAAGLAVLALLASRTPLAGSEDPGAGVQPPAPGDPTSGFRGDFLKQLTYYERRFVSLAEAIPAEKYTWAPGEGVRSISQVFLHIAQRNFIQPILVGTPPPADLTKRTALFSVGQAHGERPNPEVLVRELAGEGIVETSTASKATVVAMLKESFAHIHQAILRVSDADAEKPVKWIGDNTYRGVFFFWTRHMGEHLGQVIAYTRMNGLVPPWTQERTRREPPR